MCKYPISCRSFHPIHFISFALIFCLTLAILASAILPSTIWASTVLAETIWLDELDLSQTTCGWRQTAANRTVDGNELTVCGEKISRGVGHHAPGEIFIMLPENCGTEISGRVAIDDETNGQGHAEFLIYGKTGLLWRSGEMRGKEAPKSFRVDLSGQPFVRLVCDTLPDGYGHDHQDWIEVKIDYCGEKKPYTQLLTLGMDDEGNPIDRMNENACEWLSLSRLIQSGMRQNAKDEAFHPAATLFDTDRDPLDIVLRRLTPLVEKLETLPGAPDLTKEKAELETLTKAENETPVEEIARRKEIFAKVTDLRKRIAFKNPLLNFTDLLFIKRHYMPEPEMRGNHMCDQFFGFHGRQGGGLFVLKNAFSEKPEVVDLTKGVKVAEGQYAGTELDATWAFLSPELDYDAREILFCATDAKLPRHTYQWTPENTYHMFRAEFDPETRSISGLTQLTEGAFNDLDPCYLPNGRIIFISERRGGYGRCHGRPVPCYTLHSCRRDGSDIVMLSPHETNEWQPDIDHNGMVIYTRWDYVDRGFSQAHHPWITTPDGRDPRVLQGNYDRIQQNRPHFECDIHPIPGSRRLTATATGHHAQHYGSLILIDPNVPDSNQPGQVKRITPDQLFMESELRPHKDPTNYGTCWPLSEEFYICVYDPFSRSDAGEANNFGIYLLDCYGNRTLLYRDPKISCRDAMPIRPRARQTIVPHLTAVGKPLAPGEKFVPVDPASISPVSPVGLINVYDSKFPLTTSDEGTPAKIKSLRIVQLLPKTNPYAHNPAIGYGNQKGARRILGTVPVEEDGSAYFNLPIDIPVYFQALDENGVAVQGMRSATYVHAGEQLTCQGCHEERHSAITARPRVPQAMRRAPSTIQPEPDGTDPLNFVRLVQPVLDAKCVSCHGGAASVPAESSGLTFEQAQNAAKLDLRDETKTGHFSPSYEALRRFCFYYDDAAWTEPQTFPGKFGSNRSELFRILKAPHYGLELTKEELYRFTVWMDNNCDFYGAYDECEIQRKGEKVFPRLE